MSKLSEIIIKSLFAYRGWNENLDIYYKLFLNVLYCHAEGENHFDESAFWNFCHIMFSSLMSKSPRNAMKMNMFKEHAFKLGVHIP